MSSLILNQPWKIAEADPGAVKRFCRDMGIPEVIAGFLALRGITSSEQAEAHLSADLQNISDCRLMKDMDRALDRLAAAVEAKETLGIFGDYDADGVTASALLHLFFMEIDIASHVYFPHREHDGYGLGRKGIDWLASKGCSLIITVDCGITAVEEVKYAAASGIDIIITDHHEPGSSIPAAAAVIDPKRPECGFPFRDLAGVGVAFNLVRALRTRLRDMGFFSDSSPPLLKKYLDLVAVGTVSDVVPLFEDNRILVKNGLEVASAAERPGIAALKKVSSIKGNVDSLHVAFRMGPRINAAGRMEHAVTAFRLLVTSDHREAMRLASELDTLNIHRQEEEQRILREAEAQLHAQGPQPAYVLHSEGWQRGVVGIVASRLMEKVARPVILLAVDGDEAAGSGRSPGALDLYSILSECSHVLGRFGGHKAAAGLKLNTCDIDEFRSVMAAVVSEKLQHVDLTPALDIDAVVTMEQLSQPAFADALQRLGPFGAGYQPPAFALREFFVKSVTEIGRGHLKVIFESSMNMLHNDSNARGVSGVEMVGWGHGDKVSLPWEDFEIACEPGINVWNGRRTLQLKLIDARRR